MSLVLYLIESDEESRESLSRSCEEAGWSVDSGDTVDDLISSTACDGVPLVVLSVPSAWSRNGGGSAIARFKEWHDRNPQTQLVLLLPRSFSTGDRLALELSARHILYKPCCNKDLSNILARVAKGVGRRRRMSALRTRQGAPHGFEEIIGISDQMREVLDLAERVAKSDTTSTMITGECGTGKGALARAIHDASARRAGPFIEVNCAAIPHNLLESEFFGHEKGAFTDAKVEKIGLFECANGGTIFLDEVGEIDYSLQAKLLKFLDSRVIRKISGTQFMPVDVRVISATNSDLRQAVAQHFFRGDLFYRLNVVEIRIPPLRARPEDIRPIAESYVNKFATRLNKGEIILTDAAAKALDQYPWPGNIRELINIIERAVLLNTSGRIELGDLPFDQQRKETIVNAEVQTGRLKVNLPPEGATLDEVEKGTILAALSMAEGNIARAARILGVGRGTMRYKLKKHGIDPEEIKKNHKKGRFEPSLLTK
jgi:two-component system response regulator AtoC